MTQTTFRLELESRLEALDSLAAFLEEKGALLGLADRDQHHLALAADEAVTNVIKHGYPADQPGPILLSLSRHADRIELVIEDQGPPFDPASVKPPDLDAPLEERPIGGLGLFLMDKLMDEVQRSRQGDWNRLVLIKKL